jgi:hypothetical protein
VGGVAEVVDAKVARDTGRVVGAAWGVADVCKAGDEVVV